MAPKTSAKLSFSAPDCPWYTSPPENCTTPWLISWPITVVSMKVEKICPSPSP